jgi:TatD family-associated radical SAM protein
MRSKVQGNEVKFPKIKETICYEEFGNLYLNITNKCSANCVFCIRHICDGVYGYNLRLSREPSEEDILHELGKHDLTKYREVVFTGFGEPTCRFDTVLRITKWLHEKRLFVRLDTNGHASLMYPGRKVVSELKEAGLDAVSVSLNAESEEIYNYICKPKLEGSYPALIDFTKEAIKMGIRTRMTIVAQRDVNTRECEKFAAGLGADFLVR